MNVSRSYEVSPALNRHYQVHRHHVDEAFEKKKSKTNQKLQAAWLNIYVHGICQVVLSNEQMFARVWQAFCDVNQAVLFSETQEEDGFRYFLVIDPALEMRRDQNMKLTANSRTLERLEGFSEKIEILPRPSVTPNFFLKLKKERAKLLPTVLAVTKAFGTRVPRSFTPFDAAFESLKKKFPW